MNTDIVFPPQLEMGIWSFSGYDDWKKWRNNNPWLSFQSATTEIAQHALEHGVESAWFGRIPNHKVICNSLNYRESLLANGFNPRQRAVLELIQAIYGASRDKIDVYAAEGVTPFAKEIEQKTRLFVGSEYAPTLEEQERIHPIQHQDLAALTFNDAQFDLCIANEVFEHLPNLPSALCELHRVLRPGGILLSTFPFLLNHEEQLVKAVREPSGEIKYIMEPEYHGNPMDPENGSLVYQLPAWDILDQCRRSGFSTASMILLSSKKSAIISRDYPGVLVLLATVNS